MSGALKYCAACGGWHLRDQPFPADCEAGILRLHAKWARPKIVKLSVPYVRRDHMDGVKHPRNGTIIESRSEYDRETKEYLAENPNLVELGTEKATSNGFSDSDDIKSDVITAMKMVEQGYKPETGTAADATNGWTDPA